MINTINYQNVYNLDLQQAWEQDNNKNFYNKHDPKWDASDPKQSLIKIQGVF